MDHVDLVLEGNLDDLVGGEVGADGRVLAAGANLVGLVGLLAMHAEAVLMAVDGDGVQRQLVGGAEDADGDLAAVGDCERTSAQRAHEARGVPLTAATADAAYPGAS